ncbi:MAG: homoserine O-succinyltransferase [Proteobacteria bacterium]|nr:homoserine O-succinyltransferase [Pseudomonadota bacterium]
MKIKFITHADFETPGVIIEWAQRHSYSYEICKPYKGESCISEKEFDFLILMGGPQSACDLSPYPYLKDEISLLKDSISKSKLILGFCLGAQLIGEALGAKATKSPQKEVGVFPITLTTKGLENSLFNGFPSSFPVIHWHNDMPGETSTSQILATSPGCPIQIIQYAHSVYGFQCHLEITKEGIRELIEAGPQDLIPSLFTQSCKELLMNDYTSIHEKLFLILDRLVEQYQKMH